MVETARKQTEGPRLLNWLEQREEEMAALLGELVDVTTENPPGRK